MKENTGKNRNNIMNEDEVLQSPSAGMTRRDAVKLTAVTLAGTGLGTMNYSPGSALHSESDLSVYDGHFQKEKKELSTIMKNVKYEEMFPEELGIILKEYPVAYVPFGSLEWHGKHLPYGNDALKAHGILIRTAQKYGGVVVPPTYWGHMDYNGFYRL